LSPQDAISNLITSVYGTALGLPMNLLAPLKNVSTQFVMSSIAGEQTFWEAVGKLSDEKWMKRLFDKNLRMEFPTPGVEARTVTGPWQTFWRKTLALWYMSDQMNVLGAGSVGLLISDRLVEFHKKAGNDMTRDDVRRILWNDGKPPPRFDPSKVIKSKVLEKNLWNRELTRSVTDEAYAMLLEGKYEDMENFLAQYMVNLSQWRYGPGGTPTFQRNPWLRMTALFYTWPANYTEFNYMLIRSKALAQYLRLSLYWIMIVSVLSAMGIAKAKKWAFLGAYPEELGLQGHIIDAVNAIWGKIIGAGKEFQEEALGGFDQ
jgi:hypothetical protein